MTEYYPTLVGNKWYASYKHKCYLTDIVNELQYRDLLGDKLEFYNRDHAINWCNTRNELDNLTY